MLIKFVVSNFYFQNLIIRLKSLRQLQAYYSVNIKHFGLTKLPVMMLRKEYQWSSIVHNILCLPRNIEKFSRNLKWEKTFKLYSADTKIEHIFSPATTTQTLKFYSFTRRVWNLRNKNHSFAKHWISRMTQHIPNNRKLLISF